MVDVAIINWNTAQAALTAVESLAASTGVEAKVTLVDNRSADAERDLLRSGAQSGRFELILSERNLGFGTAANLALSGGDSALVCVGNADVSPAPTALRELAEVVLDRSDSGMAGPVFSGGTHRYHAALPGPVALLARTFVGSAGARDAPNPRPGEVAEVEQPSGAFFVMRRELWEELRGFDERFFLWYEDVDLAKRLRDRGRRNLIVGSARVGHSGAASFEQLDPRRAQAIRLASLRLYIEKHHSRLMPLARPLLGAALLTRARGSAATVERGRR